MITDRNIRDRAQEIRAKVGETMDGLEDVIGLCLVALFTKGHVLLEGNPGLGKTALVKSMADTLGLQFGRIQFTPDLMPADITGTKIPPHWEFQEGPIFKTLLLADEINRASPKTQSAMLEAMAERQITVLGEEKKLPEFFTVFATQNPIDHEGVYPLPEAQADRFMFKICLYPPKIKTLSFIIEKDAGNGLEKNPPSFNQEGGKNIHEDEAQANLKEYYKFIRGWTPHEAVNQHIRNMFLASNLRAPSLDSEEILDSILDSKKKYLEKKKLDWIKTNADIFQFGLGPRAATAMTLATKAWSLMFAEHSYGQASAADLAKVVIPVLRHRLKPIYDWEDRFKENSDYDKVKILDSQQRTDWLIKKFVQNTAPQINGYSDIFEQTLKEVNA